MQVEDGIKKTRGIPAFIAKVMEGKGEKFGRSEASMLRNKIGILG